MDAASFLLPENRATVIETLMQVVDKDGTLVPFKLKPAQRHYMENVRRTNVLPKARQLGFTTIGLADPLLECLLIENTNFLLLVQTDEDVAPTSDKLVSLYKNMKAKVRLDDGVLDVKPAFAREGAHRLSWANGSQALIRTANSERVGRSLAFHRVHGTEVAFWNDREAERVIAAVLGASGDIPRFRFTLESTGNGPSGLFYRFCTRAERDEGNWNLMFYSWLWEPGYAIAGGPLGSLSNDELILQDEFGATEEQLRWRRREMENFYVLRRLDEFYQEYPVMLKDCFQSKGLGVFTEVEKEWAKKDLRKPEENSLDGGVRCWVKPEAGCGYIIASDPSSGTADDPAAATVLDARSLRHVATVEGWYEPHVLGDILADLGVKYNYAFQRVERNTGYGQAVLRHLIELKGYWNVEYGDDGKPGIHTNDSSKNAVVSEFKAAVASGSAVTHDARVSEQMETYTRRGMKMKGWGKHEHDDVLMCLMNAIACARKNPHLQSLGGVVIRRIRG
jgi:hypothetical protein